MKDVVAYPSSIIPEGSALEPLREAKVVLSSMEIEVFHIFCFIVIMFCLLGSSWFALKKISQAQTKKAPSASPSGANPITA